MKKMMKVLVLAACTAVLALPAYSQIATIDYVGYGWEPAGPVKAAGDEFRFLGIADYLDPVFGVDLGVDEVTLYVHGLTSLGEIDLGGVIMVNYSGGSMEIYQDSAQNADWGIDPPNATAPSTFEDGTLFFSGQFTSMAIFYGPDGNGSFEGTVDGTAGSMIGDACANCVYTWGGVFTSGTGAQVLEGYTLQVDGVLEVDAAVSSDSSTWDAVKALFGN